MSIWRSMGSAGQQAFICFTASLAVFVVCFASAKYLGFTQELWALTYWGPALYFSLFSFVLRYCYSGFAYEVSIRAAFLGATFATGLFLTTYDDGWRAFGLYTMLLSFFHFSEFLAVAMTNPRSLTIDSFILNHSLQYALAALASWAEWATEYYWVPDMKKQFWISYMGFAMSICGEVMRKLAMFTARTNFNHTVQYVKQPDHQLVTHGVYSLCRHPSYVGWFYWSVGTQITLINPICFFVYLYASWSFFNERIQAEEMTLIAFFGKQYLEYQKKVGTGLPLINGYTGDEDMK